jgi:hypothetical protein
MKVIISHSSTDNLKKYGDQLMMDYFDDIKNELLNKYEKIYKYVIIQISYNFIII